MNKAELDSKPLAELHALAAKADLPRYRMLSRGELIEKLAGGAGPGPSQKREPRQRQQRKPRSDRERQPRERQPRGGQRQPRRSEEERPEPPASAPTPEPAPGADASEKPKRRRRRRFGRRGRKTIRIQDVLLPAAPGRQALVYAETRAGCTALLRELAAELSGDKGPDPVALLIDPSPEELADWKREAPKAEIVSAGQERHATDALAQAARRAESGEAVVFLIDSLSRAAGEFGGLKLAKELFDAGQMAPGAGSGSLTIVAALERSGE
jgi:hypothetical protein